jgi:outer membrane protein assembly factor BamB
VTSAHRLATRCILGTIVATGACIALGTVSPTRVAGAPASLTLNETWGNPSGPHPGVVLNDAPCGVVQASPVAFNDFGISAVEVGDRQGNLYGLNLQDGSVAPGWGSGTGSTVGSGQGCLSAPVGGPPASGINGVEVPGSPPVDSTASVSNGDLYFGAGNAAAPVDGGYYAYAPNGTELWNQVVTNPPTDTAPDGGVQASLSVADGGSLVEGGSLGQMTYGLNAASGAPARGWPQFSADSVFSTAAAGDFYGTGSDDFAVGGASSQGFALGTHYANGGHVRIYNDHGGLICSADTNEQVDSSPAVGPILPGGAYGIATGTGSFYPGASDENTVKVYDTKCNPIWSDALDGTTGGSPALADVQGNGQLAVVEGTVTGGTSGSVYALNAANGTTMWKTSVPGAIYGSVTTADLTGSGAQDVIVPTTQGLFILDGPTGLVVAHVDDGTGGGGVFGFQNAALVTPDADGSIGITVAGYFAVTANGGNYVQGIVQHFEVQGSNFQIADAPGGWPQFHHDAALTGFVGGGAAQGSCDRPAASQNGYLTVASDGGIFAFGQDFCGSTGSIALNRPVVGMAAVPRQGGYWLVASDGGVFSYGDAGFYGSTGSLKLNAPVVGMAATPDGRGYWLVASDGGIFSYGDAGFYGSAAAVPGQDIVAMAASPDGLGYWEVSTTGRVFSFGDATPAGDIPSLGLHLNGFIVGITPDPVTGGYWLVGSDGGIFSFGAPFFGSTGSIHLNQPVVAMQSTGDGQGYWFVASDGGIFAYGDAPFRGSMGGQHLNRPMVGMDGF